MLTTVPAAMGNTAIILNTPTGMGLRHAPAAEHSDPHSHKHSRKHASAGARVYNARRPEQTPLYRTVAEHFETWLELASFRSV